jgi:hypothetical protein
MTRTIGSTLRAAIAAALVAVGSAGAASAGSLSITYAPTDPRQADALRAGLTLYSLVNRLQEGATIRQLGANNLAGIGQNGFGNAGVIEQRGDGHAAALQQNGNHNSYGIFQFGRRTRTDVVQSGNGGAGATFAFGW